MFDQRKKPRRETNENLTNNYYLEMMRCVLIFKNALNFSTSLYETNEEPKQKRVFIYLFFLAQNERKVETKSRESNETRNI